MLLTFHGVFSLHLPIDVVLACLFVLIEIGTSERVNRVCAFAAIPNVSSYDPRDYFLLVLVLFSLE